MRIRRKLLDETFDHFRKCGRGRRECVAYWLGPRAEAGLVTEVVHPPHRATAMSYDVDGQWVNELWLRLADEALTVRAQVHTHPGSAFHSSRDDDRAAVQSAGFASLVIPCFAQGAVSLDDAHLVVRERDGGWKVGIPADVIEVS